jgi:hypothetical protein
LHQVVYFAETDLASTLGCVEIRVSWDRSREEVGIKAVDSEVISKALLQLRKILYSLDFNSDRLPCDTRTIGIFHEPQRHVATLQFLRLQQSQTVHRHDFQGLVCAHVVSVVVEMQALPSSVVQVVGLFPLKKVLKLFRVQEVEEVVAFVVVKVCQLVVYCARSLLHVTLCLARFKTVSAADLLVLLRLRVRFFLFNHVYLNNYYFILNNHQRLFCGSDLSS